MLTKEGRQKRVEWLVDNYDRLDLTNYSIVNECKKKKKIISKEMRSLGLLGPASYPISLINLVIDAGKKKGDPKFDDIRSSVGIYKTKSKAKKSTYKKISEKDLEKLRIKYLLDRQVLWYGWPFGPKPRDIYRKVRVARLLAIKMKRAGLYSKNLALSNIDIDELINRVRTYRRLNSVRQFTVGRQFI